MPPRISVKTASRTPGALGWRGGASASSLPTSASVLITRLLGGSSSEASPAAAPLCCNMPPSVDKAVVGGEVATTAVKRGGLEAPPAVACDAVSPSKWKASTTLSPDAASTLRAKSAGRVDGAA
jgi:hypothetical protein